MAGFTIDLDAVPAGSSRVQVVSSAQELGLAPSDWLDGIDGDLELERSGDRISVRGSLNAVARLDCVLCLRACELAVRAPFELFAERGGTGFRLEEEELERGDYMKFHDGRKRCCSSFRSRRAAARTAGACAPAAART
jgi:hypothetical protein